METTVKSDPQSEQADEESGKLSRDRCGHGILAIVLSFFGFSLLHASVAFPGWWGINWVAVWNANNWVASWEHGFLMRGLVGTLVRTVCGSTSLKTVLVVGTVATGVYLMVLGWMASKLYLKDRGNGMLVMVLFCLSQPCVVQWWFSPVMFGRLDIFIVIATVMSLACVTFLAGLWRYIVLICVAALAMLVHEGFGVLFVPLIFACLFSASAWDGNEVDLKPVVLYLAPALAGWLAIALCGKPSLSYQDFLVDLRSHAVGFEVFGDDFVRLAYFMSFGERIKASVSCLTWDMGLRILATLLFMAPTVWILRAMWGAVWRVAKPFQWRRVAVAVLLVASFSPLAAFVLGCDYFRWIEYGLFNNLMALGALAYWDGGNRRVLLDVVSRKQWLIMAVIIMNTAAGVPGALTTYPFIELMDQLIRRLLGA